MSLSRILPVALLLTGCAGDRGAFPSLQQRPIERRSDAEPEVPVLVAAPDPALDARVAAFRNKLSDNRAAFDAADRAAVRTVAAGGRAAVGSDAWIDAQTALAGLDEHRARMLDLVADIDAAARERAAALAAPYPGLDAMRADAEAELERQIGVLAQRNASVRPA